MPRRDLAMRGLLLVCGLLLVGPVRGEGLDLATDFVSEYVFRGMTQRQGASIQSSLSYGILGTLKASLWANLRLEGAVALSETDYSLDWTWLNASPAALRVGWIYYDRNGSLIGPETQELFAGLDFNVTGQPSLYLFYDYDNKPGGYFELRGAHQFLLPDYKGTVDLSLSLGLDAGRFNDFQDARMSIGFTRYLGDWRISPSIDLHFPAGDVDPSAHGFRPVFRFSASRSF